MTTDGEAESVADRAYAAIREAIVVGAHAPGAMLSENALAASLGVSRTPVRSALARLQDEGWLTVYPKRGALVRRPSGKEIADLCDLRLILESAGVQRSDPASRGALADRLESMLRTQAAAIRAADLPAFIRSTVGFHRSFLEVAGNALLLEIGDQLADRQRQLLHLAGEQLIERGDDILDEHRDLIHRLRAGDVKGFAEVLRVHVLRTLGPDLPSA